MRWFVSQTLSLCPCLGISGFTTSRQLIPTLFEGTPPLRNCALPNIEQSSVGLWDGSIFLVCINIMDCSDKMWSFWEFDGVGQIVGLSSTEFGLASMIWGAVVVAKVRSTL